MLSQAVGKMVKLPIMKGEALEMGKLLDAGGFINVRDGMRAITIQVDAVGGLNGSLIPGSHVDILTTVAQNEGRVTRTLLQDIQVITVGEGAPSAGGAANGSGGGTAKPVSTAGMPVTLVVSPKQAELLTLANTVGSFHLTLRNFSDKRTNKMNGADITTLMTGTEPDALSKILPSKPHAPSGADGFHNVNYSPDAMNLPAPSAGAPSGSRFSMQIYRGTGSETMDFQQ